MAKKGGLITKTYIRNGKSYSMAILVDLPGGKVLIPCQMGISYTVFVKTTASLNCFFRAVKRKKKNYALNEI